MFRGSLVQLQSIMFYSIFFVLSIVIKFSCWYCAFSDVYYTVGQISLKLAKNLKNQN